MICKNALSRFHTDKADGSAAERKLFRPLYQHLSDPDETPGDETQLDSADIIEEAKERGLQKGLRSGQSEARSMLKASLLPMLTSFLKSYNNLMHLEEKIRTRALAAITELGSDIAERILSEPADMDAKHLQNRLRNGLPDVKGLRLNIHPNDLQALKNVFAESGLEWTHRMQALLKANAAVQPGEVRVENHCSPMGEQIIQAFADHFDASTAASDPAGEFASTK
jgi:flagellar biosynthesis/type III secretory pathway protein FliH